MFDKIVFFHNHVNGDSFLSKNLVKQIITATKYKNICYYYTAPRSILSYCLDLGILDEHFNVINVPYKNLTYFIYDNILFINVWIGIITYSNEDLNITCSLCLNNLIPKYNILINSLNNDFNMNIELLNDDKNLSPYISINHEFYNNTFIDNFIKKNKEKYEKIVLICNNIPTTFISVINITQTYLSYITQKFPNYLFVTFDDENLNVSNLISIKQIYSQNNIQITHNLGIIFSLLSTLSDKVILLPTGLSLTCFNNETIKNKFIMLFDFSNSGNPYNCNYCKNDRQKLCTNRFGWDITLIDVDYTDVNINNKICYCIEDFLRK